MKVLVPLDGSRLADGMLAHARRLSLRQDTELHLLRVLEPATGSQAEREERFAEARRHLTECRELLETHGRVKEVRTRLVEGDPAEQILSCLDLEKPDLVAMSTHGRSGLGRWVRGSVAERVLRNSPVPAFLANPQGLVLESDEALRFGKILVPLDGSPLSLQIMPLVNEFAVDRDAEVVLLHVDTPTRGGVHPVPEVASRNAQQRAEQTLDDLRCQLEEDGVHKTRVIGRYGADVAGIVLEVIENLQPDLVAMTSHGRTGISRWRFGSVAEKILRACACPILIRPAGAARHKNEKAEGSPSPA